MDDQQIQQVEKPIAVAKASPRDVFLHLLSMVTLYVSAISFLTLIFQYVNLAIPDALDSSYYNIDGYQRMIRFAIAMLVVFFPAYILSSRFLYKLYETNPEKKKLKIRKWLTYFTLFAAAIVIMGFLVGLINSLLGGELTLRFTLKVVAVLFVAGGIFSYYLWGLKKDKSEE